MTNKSLAFSFLTLAALAVTPATAQTYPIKTIRLVTGEPGGSGDFAARLLAQGLSASLGQAVIVDNRVGTVIPGETVAKANADGYTLLVYGSPLWTVPLLQGRSRDLTKEFAPITLAVSIPDILAVYPQLPAASVQELITLAKAKPGALNYGAAEIGSSAHLAAELFRSMADIRLTGVHYRGTPPAIADLITGQVQIVFGVTNAMTPHVKSNRIKALAVTSPQPTALAPGLPTVAVSGLPGYEYLLLSGLFAPGGTSPAIVKQLNQHAVQALNRSDIKEKFFNAGVETIASSPEYFVSAINADTARLGKVIKDAGIHIQ